MSTELIKPLIPESSTSESTSVEVVMNDMRDKTLTIPDYQRDGDQWDEPTKSLLVESVINNLTIPAFFFEVYSEEGVEKNDVVDGQQRLTTLSLFHTNKMRLVESDDAPYLSPTSVHYAGKTFDELPLPLQQAFKKYRLTIIKLRDLKEMKLEVFRRINQGGTPLSGQDIRLAYYGEGSMSVTFLRLAGVYDASRPAAKRFIESALSNHGIKFPWTKQSALDTWKDWWEDKEIARGQTASEMFLWSIIAAQANKLDSLLQNPDALAKLNCRFNRAADEAMDACCAQLRYQERNPAEHPLLMTYDELSGKFFPHFEQWIDSLLGKQAVNLPVSKHRIIAAIIGGAFFHGVGPDELTTEQWDKVVDFIRRPQEKAKILGDEWPVSRGRWDGKKGYKSQLNHAQSIVGRIIGRIIE